MGSGVSFVHITCRYYFWLTHQRDGPCGYRSPRFVFFLFVLQQRDSSNTPEPSRSSRTAQPEFHSRGTAVSSNHKQQQFSIKLSGSR